MSTSQVGSPAFAPGDAVGGYRVVESTSGKLVIKRRNLGALGLIALGVLGFAWGTMAYVAFFTHSAEAPTSLSLLLPFLGLGMAVVGVLQLGLSFTFDAATQTVARRRLVGVPKTWDSADVTRVRLTVEAATLEARECLFLDLCGGEEDLVERLCCRKTEARATVRVAALAQEIARVLGVPLIVKGKVVKGRVELREALAQ